MQSGAVPPSLSDLFLPDPHGDQAMSANSANSAAEADRFARYLQSARHSVGAEGALPAMARSEAPPPGGRPDARRDPIDRAERPLSNRAKPAERSQPTGRDDDVVSRDDRGGPRDDRSVGRSDDRTERVSAEDERAAKSAGGAEDTTSADGGTGTTEATTSDTGAVAVAEGTEGTATDETIQATAVDIDIDLAALVEAGPIDEAAATDETSGPGVGADTAVDGAAEATADTDDDDIDEAGRSGTDPSVLAAHLERAAEQVAALAVTTDQTTAASVTIGPSADDESTVGAAPSIDEGSAALTGGEQPEADETIDRSEGSAVQGDTVDSGADAATVDGGEAAIDPAAGRAATTTVDGPDVAPVVQQVGNQVNRSAEISGNQVSGVESATGPGAARNRPTPTTTAAAQNTDGPAFDGDAGDPLWLQVRRAMGSLRNLQNGEQELTIRLRPAELGSVVVRVNAGEHGTRVSLLTDSAVAANQLGQQRQELISELERNGLGGVAVDISNSGNPGNPETPNSDGDGPGNGPGGSAAGAAAALAGATTATLPRSGGRGRRPGAVSGGLVDVDL